MTLPGENGQNLVEWRFRKEQNRGKVIVFGRKLRVSVRMILTTDSSSVGVDSFFQITVFIVLNFENSK